MLAAKGLKSRIIALLAEEFPLQVQQILGEVAKRDERGEEKGPSKQAVHKALNQLIAEGVVHRVYRAYQLNPEYVLEVERWAEQAKQRYFARKAEDFAVAANGRRIFSCRSLLEQQDLWNSILDEKLRAYPSRTYALLQHVPHAWSSLSVPEIEQRVTGTIAENADGFYTLVNGSTPLDRWAERMFEMRNAYYRCRSNPVPGEYNHQYAVFGSYVLQSRYPRGLALRIARLFDATPSIAKLNLQELVAIIHAPCDLKLVLRNSERLAAKLGDELFAEFR